jgi:2,3-diketo-5-methylthio-1-phosphopentane phosphatase
MRRELPPAEIFCDFDGTITLVDATDAVLEAFALPAWREWEARWVEGEISSRQCLARQVELLRTDPETLTRFAEGLQVDPGILDLDRRCSERGIRLTIVSDGLDFVARAILRRVGLLHLPLYANHLVPGDAGTWSLSSPYAQPRCESAAGTCKCAVAGIPGGRRTDAIYIGDGRSDLCVAGNVATLFAKGWLQRWCASRKIPHHSFETLSDVTRSLFSSEASAR